jgi:hypothetical protein
MEYRGYALRCKIFPNRLGVTRRDIVENNTHTRYVSVQPHRGPEREKPGAGEGDGKEEHQQGPRIYSEFAMEISAKVVPMRGLQSRKKLRQ